MYRVYLTTKLYGLGKITISHQQSATGSCIIEILWQGFSMT